MGSHDLSNMANIRSAMCHMVETEVIILVGFSIEAGLWTVDWTMYWTMYWVAIHSMQCYAVSNIVS